MARSLFFSFHYQRDIWRVNVVRNHYLTKGGYTVAGYWDHSLWEETKRHGSAALERLIQDGLRGTSVTVVLIGAETALRPWVQYEIQQSAARSNGFVGIWVHNIRNLDGYTDSFGTNPLDNIAIPDVYGIQRPLSYFYPTYDWVIDNGYESFGSWVERAAQIAGK